MIKFITGLYLGHGDQPGGGTERQALHLKQAPGRPCEKGRRRGARQTARNGERSTRSAAQGRTEERSTTDGAERRQRRQVRRQQTKVRPRARSDKGEERGGRCGLHNDDGGRSRAAGGVDCGTMAMEECLVRRAVRIAGRER